MACSSTRRWAALIVFLLLWFQPVAFLQGLANNTKLSESKGFTWLRGWDNTTAQRLLVFIEGMLPQINLSVFLILIPIIIIFAIGFERIPYIGDFESKVHSMVCFFIVSNFVYIVLAGSVLQQLQDIIDNPSLDLIVEILSTTIPEQATFLMGYILFNGFVGFPVAQHTAIACTIALCSCSSRQSCITIHAGLEVP